MRYLYVPQSKQNDPASLLTPLPPMAWIVTLVAAALSIVMTLVIVSVYKALKEEDGLLVGDTLRMNEVFLKMLGSLTEPDALDFFPRWSTGKIDLEKICPFDA